MNIPPLLPMIRTALGLSREEDAVLEAVRMNWAPRRAAIIAKKIKIKRYTVNRILRKLEKRGLVEPYSDFPEKAGHTRWGYNRRFDRLRFKHLSEK